MSEGFADLLGETIGTENIESIEEIVEAVVAYCDCARTSRDRSRQPRSERRMGLDRPRLDGWPRV